MSNLPINWEDKIDSPELVAWLQQFGLGRYINAEQINKLRDAINELYYTLNPDRIITIGTETIVDNEHTYEGYVWQLGGIQINNTGNPSIIIIPAATVGFKRKDISVFTAEGNIIRVAGDETDGDIVATPPTPPGTLYFKSYDINGDTIAVDPEPPAIDGSIYKKKIENTRWKSTQSGTNVVIPFQAAGQMHYSVVHSGLISVAGFSTAALTTPQYEGQDLLFENQTGNSITLKNMFGGVSTPFNFGADLIVPNGGKLWLKVRNNEIELIMKSWSDVDLSSKADLVDGKVPSSQLPSYVDDVLEFANLAAFPVTGETGKIYVALDTNFTYRWTGSVYLQISVSLSTLSENRAMFTDFITGSSSPFSSAVIGSGTSIGYAIAMSSKILGTVSGGGGNADNAGGRTSTNMGDINMEIDGLTYINAFFIYSEPNSLLRNGFTNSATHVEPTSGIYMQLQGNSASFKSTKIISGTPYTSTSSSFTIPYKTWLVLMVERVSSTSAKFKLKNMLTGALVSEAEITKNIPGKVACGAGFIWTVAPFTGFGSDYVLDYMGVWYKKPQFLNDF